MQNSRALQHLKCGDLPGIFILAQVLRAANDAISAAATLGRQASAGSQSDLRRAARDREAAAAAQVTGRQKGKDLPPGRTG